MLKDTFELAKAERLMSEIVQKSRGQASKPRLPRLNFSCRTLHLTDKPLI